MDSSDRLVALAITQRNSLESLLFQFDQDWNPSRLGEYWRKLKDDGQGDLYRKLAIVELIKIDLQRRWSEGKGPLLEKVPSPDSSSWIRRERGSGADLRGVHVSKGGRSQTVTRQL